MVKNKLQILQEKYNEYKSLNLDLNMARGKPCPEQTNLSLDILNAEYVNGLKSKDGTDVTNYGVLDGIIECKDLFSQILQVPSSNIIIFGNSSLNIMYDYISQCMVFGAGDEPWIKQGNIKFLCPVPGYDRHFGILEHFGIEMINIPIDEFGPNMELIDEYVKDSSVKGLFCVPMYSNPGGVSFSEDVIKRFASLKPAAKDFRVIWDNAYCVHHLSDDCDKFYNIFEYAEKYSNEDIFIEVTSTSKITFPGAGVSALAASDANVKAIKKRMTYQTIGHDKINQFRHCNFLTDLEAVNCHMKKHAEIIKPKFDIILKGLEENLKGIEGFSWTYPKGGYFISLDVPTNCAKRTVELCKECGVTLTGAGATYPYGKDPEDRNIRIAPTFPSCEELSKAVEILCLCAQIAQLEQ